MKKINNLLCNCGSQLAFSACCAPYLEGSKLPSTAKALMRSRYTAYTLANIDYIQATMCEKAAENFDALSAQSWAKAVKWKRLKVISSYNHENDPKLAYVEFIAFYNANGQLQQLHEISEFKFIENRWFYVGSRS